MLLLTILDKSIEFLLLLFIILDKSIVFCIVDKLLKPVEVTDEVLDIADKFEQVRHAIENDVLSEYCIVGEWKYACYKCDYFSQHCVGRGVDHPVFQIPRLGEKKFNILLTKKRMKMKKKFYYLVILFLPILFSGCSNLGAAWNLGL